jgi:hypothetical protein
MNANWEQSGQGVEGEAVDEVVQRYLQDDSIAANGSRPGPGAAPEQETSSGEGSGTDSELIERAVAQALEKRLASLRQDLEEYADRRVQSFSDKTAHRLSQQQRQQLEQLDRTLDGLQDLLGPDFDAIKRQKQLDILLANGGEAGETEQRSATQQQAEPQPSRQSGDFASAYLATKLGDPSEWNQEARAAIQRDLSQAGDWDAWMAVVDRYAEQRPGRMAQGQGTSDSGAPSVARAQPVGVPAGKRSAPSLDALNRALNRAAAEGDLDAMEKIGRQIDAALTQQR